MFSFDWRVWNILNRESSQDMIAKKTCPHSARTQARQHPPRLPDIVATPRSTGPPLHPSYVGTPPHPWGTVRRFDPTSPPPLPPLVPNQSAEGSTNHSDMLLPHAPAMKLELAMSDNDQIMLWMWQAHPPSRPGCILDSSLVKCMCIDTNIIALVSATMRVVA